MALDFLLHNPVDPDNDIENLAFTGYAAHEQEKEDIIQMIIRNYNCGETEMSFAVNNDFSDEDVKDIENEVQKRLGLYDLF